MQALHSYGPRYRRILESAGIAFTEPGDPAELIVVERLAGGSGTDFGAPEAVPSADSAPVDDAELERQQALLMACWQALDTAAQSAAGKELRKGPRGGGRELEGIIEHVFGANAGYLSRIGWKMKYDGADLREKLAQSRAAVLEALARSAHGEVSAQGPRGGARWTPRYFVRRSAWHILDHVWEIEDRLLE